MTNEELQSHLIQLADNWTTFQHAHKLSGLSLHITPDSCWIAKEHEVEKLTDELTGCNDTVITRLSPACHEIITKI